MDFGWEAVLACRYVEEAVEWDFFLPRMDVGNLEKGDFEAEDEGAEELRGAVTEVEVGGGEDEEEDEEDVVEVSPVATAAAASALWLLVEFDADGCGTGGVVCPDT